jgi:flavin reductase (DIM6/NTAB) family NADH-FMN oxidoreductase RutF
MTADDFKMAMRRVPTGIAIVTTLLDGKPKGFTANAFASVSIDPPIVLICVNRQGRSHPIISESGRFCLNLLALEQADLARRFAAHGDADPFAGVKYTVDGDGAPVIEGALAYFDCELTEEHSAGTHTIFLGNVAACGYRDGAPLGYFNADYRDFGCRI